MKISRLVISKETFKITLISLNKALLDIISKNLVPYYESSFQHVDISGWTIFIGQQAKSDIMEASSIVDVVKPQGEPERRYIISKSDKFILIESPIEDIWQVQHAYRLIRVLSRIHFYNQGMRFFHGGFIEYCSHGIAFMGGKRSGKTTSILTTLSNSQSAFVTNDDLGIRISKDGVLGYGWPRAVSVRKDTLNLPHIYKYLAGKQQELNHPANSVMNNPLYTFFYPREISDTFSSKLEPTSKVNVVIFPGFANNGNEVKTKRLTKDQFFEKLTYNFESEFNKYSDFLSDHIHHDDNWSRQVIDKLASSVEGYEVVQDFDRMLDLNTVLDSILNGEIK
ncbi:hypothetical protein Ppb6_04084 [Photorhabdus australis subsp. thailandensis]|uniref:Uncharacterized protein n=1 Tax=Photorhabdus australis subsp. thailandensis TaxID=2805096 RepID=A0A1C0TZG5_9GAMM|nr:hypothetical protein [Photorhabdus australis]OCQ50986.1 hypothetical protein Ppb6_04084 [Photorhabdus australis subsp. thailandensis]